MRKNRFVPRVDELPLRIAPSTFLPPTTGTSDTSGGTTTSTSTTPPSTSTNG